MSAYIIAAIDIHDRVAYAAYAGAAGPAVEQYGGRYLVVSDKVEVLEGEAAPVRHVIISFSSADQARAWWSSPEYEAAKVLRRQAASSRFVLVED